MGVRQLRYGHLTGADTFSLLAWSRPDRTSVTSVAADSLSFSDLQSASNMRCGVTDYGSIAATSSLLLLQLQPIACPILAQLQPSCWILRNSFSLADTRSTSFIPLYTILLLTNLRESSHQATPTFTFQPANPVRSKIVSQLDPLEFATSDYLHSYVCSTASSKTASTLSLLTISTAWRASWASCAYVVRSFSSLNGYLPCFLISKAYSFTSY